MKRITTLMLALLMTCAISVTAFADISRPSEPARESSGTSAATVTAPGRTTVLLENKANFITVGWKKVKNADAYMVYRRAIGETKYTRVKKTKALVFRDRDVEAGKVYRYKVKAYRKVDGETIVGRASAYKQICRLDRPQLNEAACVTNGISLKWDPTEEATGYKIYRKTPPLTKYVKIGSTKDTEYVDTTVTEGGSYFYRVKAYKKIPDESPFWGTFLSEPSSTIFTSYPE